MKIVYCLNSIRYLGGVQRVTIVKANALAAIPGNKLYIIVTDNKNGVSMGKLDPKIKLIDLDVNYYEDDWKSKYHVIKGIVSKRKEHRKKMKRVLTKIQPDIVISVGQSEKNFIPRIKGPWKTIREFHFVADYRKRAAHSAFQKILAWGGSYFEKNFTLKRYDQIVTLTQEDKALNWKGWTNVKVIPNPTSFISEKVTTFKNSIVVSTGRLNSQKNYRDLIDAFSIVAKKHSKWSLEIYGEGEEKQILEEHIKSIKLEKNIMLKGYSNDIHKHLLQSSIVAYSSIFEGFPLAFIEAMECGVPIVAYACPCGPQDIISNREDGFLVAMGNKQMLADKICELIEDPLLLRRMGNEAKKKASNYHAAKIAKQWMDLFLWLLEQKTD